MQIGSGIMKMTVKHISGLVSFLGHPLDADTVVTKRSREVVGVEFWDKPAAGLLGDAVPRTRDAQVGKTTSRFKNLKPYFWARVL